MTRCNMETMGWDRVEDGKMGKDRERGYPEIRAYKEAGIR